MNPPTPAPGDLSARHVEVLREVVRAAKAAQSRLNGLMSGKLADLSHDEFIALQSALTHADAAIAALFALPDWTDDLRARQVIADAIKLATGGSFNTPADVADWLRDELAALSALPAGGGLFALHLMGPDSVYAAPSFEAALRVANAVNLDFADRPVKPYAVVVPWSGDAESHAAGLADWEGTWN